MKWFEFQVVNSFAAKEFGGNPAGVFTDAQLLKPDTMQAIARQMNLVETVFVLPPELPEADFRLRYFTPEEELPVAGHPTIAACVALNDIGRIHPEIKQLYRIQTEKGVVKARLHGSGDELIVFMELPAPVFGEEAAERRQTATVLGLDEDELMPDLPVAPVDTGLGHLIVPVKSLRSLMRIARNATPLRVLCDRFGMREVQAFTFEVNNAGNQLYTRNICPREGLEDPACGSGNGALAAYLAKYRYAGQQRFEVRAEQGDIVNMPSLITCRAELCGGEWKVSVGGPGRVMIRGRFYL